MVALILECARAARSEAERLRLDSESLRFTVHGDLLRATATRERAAAAAATRRPFPLASPWSSLVWLSEDGSLTRTLVPLD
jgi:hypothetical protein